MTFALTLTVPGAGAGVTAVHVVIEVQSTDVASAVTPK
jgi:hypothetical protein